MDLAASSDRTRELLGWEPREIGLMDDLETGDFVHHVHSTVAS